MVRRTRPEVKGVSLFGREDLLRKLNRLSRIEGKHAIPAMRRPHKVNSVSDQPCGKLPPVPVSCCFSHVLGALMFH